MRNMHKVLESASFIDQSKNEFSIYLTPYICFWFLVENRNYIILVCKNHLHLNVKMHTLLKNVQQHS